MLGHGADARGVHPDTRPIARGNEPDCGHSHRDDPRQHAAGIHLQLPMDRRRWVMNLNKRQQLLAILAIVAVGFFVADKLVIAPLTSSWKARAVRLEKLK